MDCYTFIARQKKMNPQDLSPDKQNEARPHTPDMDSALPPGADAEERFNNFWKENGVSIFISIVIGAMIVIGAQTWRYVNQRIENNTQIAYAAADTDEKLIAFTQDHPKHHLAGAAFLQLASEDYAKGQYKQAAEHYALAKDKLAGTPFGERATLGVAMSELVEGNVQSGVTDLRAIVDNPEYLEVTRAEAAFNLALYYLKIQDYKSMSGIVDIADTFGQKNVYAEMTRTLRNQIPEQK
jgi:predicted negative regulator of RcsB-dependent stress response